MNKAEHIIAVTSKVYGVSVHDVLSRVNKREVAEARQMAMYICLKQTSASLTKIGSAFDRSHASVIHAVRKIDDFLEFDRKTKDNYNQIIESL